MIFFNYFHKNPQTTIAPNLAHIISAIGGVYDQKNLPLKFGNDIWSYSRFEYIIISYLGTLIGKYVLSTFGLGLFCFW